MGPLLGAGKDLHHQRISTVGFRFAYLKPEVGGVFNWKGRMQMASARSCLSGLHSWQGLVITQRGDKPGFESGQQY